jgi:hypothetical protein
MSGHSAEELLTSPNLVAPDAKYCTFSYPLAASSLSTTSGSKARKLVSSEEQDDEDVVTDEQISITVDLTLGEDVNELVAANSDVLVTDHQRFCFLWSVRCKRLLLPSSFRQRRMKRQLLFWITTAATAITISCCSDTSVMSKFFQNKTHLLKDFLYLIRTGPGSQEVHPGQSLDESSSSTSTSGSSSSASGSSSSAVRALVTPLQAHNQLPVRIRGLCVYCLCAIVNSRESASASVLGRFNWLQQDLGVNKSQSMGLLPCLLRSALASLICEEEIEEFPTGKSFDLGCVGPNDIGCIYFNVWACYTDYVTRLMWLEWLLLLALALVGMTSEALPAFTSFGIVQSLIAVMAKPPPRTNLVSGGYRRPHLRVYLDCLVLQLLDTCVGHSSQPHSIFREYHGVDVLLERLVQETLALHFIDSSGHTEDDILTALNELVNGNALTLPSSAAVAASVGSRVRIRNEDMTHALVVLFHQLLEAILFCFQDELSEFQVSAGGPHNTALFFSQVAKGSSLSFCLSAIFINAVTLTMSVAGCALHLMIDCIENDIAPPGVASHVVSCGLATTALRLLFTTSLGGILNQLNGLEIDRRGRHALITTFDGDTLNGFAQLINAISLTAEGKGLVAGFNPFIHLFGVFIEAQHYQPTGGMFLQPDCAVNVGASIEELIRHHPEMLILCMPSLVEVLTCVCNVLHLVVHGNYQCGGDECVPIGEVKAKILADIAETQSEILTETVLTDGFMHQVIDNFVKSWMKIFVDAAYDDTDRQSISATTKWVRSGFDFLRIRASYMCLKAVEEMETEQTTEMSSCPDFSAHAAVKVKVGSVAVRLYSQYVQMAASLCVVLDSLLTRKAAVEMFVSKYHGIELLFRLRALAIGPHQSALASMMCVVNPLNICVGHLPLVLILTSCMNRVRDANPGDYFAAVVGGIQEHTEGLETNLQRANQLFQSNSSYASRATGVGSFRQLLPNFLDKLDVVQKIVEGCQASRTTLSICTTSNSFAFAQVRAVSGVIRQFVLMDFCLDAFSRSFQNSSSTLTYDALLAALAQTEYQETLRRVFEEVYVCSQLESVRCKDDIIRRKELAVKAQPYYRLLVIARDSVLVKDSSDDTGKRVCRYERGACITALERSVSSNNALKFRTDDGWISLYRSTVSTEPQVEVMELISKPRDLQEQEIAARSLSSLTFSAVRTFNVDKLTNISYCHGGFTLFHRFHETLRELIYVLAHPLLSTSRELGDIPPVLSCLPHCKFVSEVFLNVVSALVPLQADNVFSEAFSRDYVGCASHKAHESGGHKKAKHFTFSFEGAHANVEEGDGALSRADGSSPTHGEDASATEGKRDDVLEELDVETYFGKFATVTPPTMSAFSYGQTAQTINMVDFMSSALMSKSGTRTEGAFMLMTLVYAADKTLLKRIMSASACVLVICLRSSQTVKFRKTGGAGSPIDPVNDASNYDHWSKITVPLEDDEIDGAYMESMLTTLRGNLTGGVETGRILGDEPTFVDSTRQVDKEVDAALKRAQIGVLERKMKALSGIDSVLDFWKRCLQTITPGPSPIESALMSSSRFNHVEFKKHLCNSLGAHLGAVLSHKHFYSLPLSVLKAVLDLTQQFLKFLNELYRESTRKRSRSTHSVNFSAGSAASEASGRLLGPAIGVAADSSLSPQITVSDAGELATGDASLSSPAGAQSSNGAVGNDLNAVSAPVVSQPTGEVSESGSDGVPAGARRGSGSEDYFSRWGMKACRKLSKPRLLTVHEKFEANVERIFRFMKPGEDLGQEGCNDIEYFADSVSVDDLWTYIFTVVPMCCLRTIELTNLCWFGHWNFIHIEASREKCTHVVLQGLVGCLERQLYDGPKAIYWKFTLLSWLHRRAITLLIQRSALIASSVLDRSILVDDLSSRLFGILHSILLVMLNCVKVENGNTLTLVVYGLLVFMCGDKRHTQLYPLLLDALQNVSTGLFSDSNVSLVAANPLMASGLRRDQKPPVFTHRNMTVEINSDIYWITPALLLVDLLFQNIVVDKLILLTLNRHTTDNLLSSPPCISALRRGNCDPILTQSGLENIHKVTSWLNPTSDGNVVSDYLLCLTCSVVHRSERHTFTCQQEVR